MGCRVQGVSVRFRMNSRDKFKAEWEAAKLRRKAELDLLEQVLPVD